MTDSNHSLAPEAKKFLERFLKTEKRKRTAEVAPWIGRTVISWNRLHRRLWIMFIILNSGNPDFASSAWNALSSDRSQRDMLLAVIKARFPRHDDDPTKDDSLGTALIYALGRFQSLEDTRNNIIHAPYLYVIGTQRLKIRTDHDSGNKRALNLKFKDVREECKRAVKRFEEVHDYFTLLTDNLLRVAEGLPAGALPEAPQGLQSERKNRPNNRSGRNS